VIVLSHEIYMMSLLWKIPVHVLKDKDHSFGDQEYLLAFMAGDFTSLSEDKSCNAGTIVLLQPEKLDREGVTLSIAESFVSMIKGFNARQRDCSEQRFYPVAMGAGRESLSYLDDLEEFIMTFTSGKLYQNGLIDMNLNVLYADTISHAVGKTLEMVAAKLDGDNEFDAVKDAVLLTLSINPDIAAEYLNNAWNILMEKEKRGLLPSVVSQDRWDMEHKFILACYPVCQSEQAHKVSSILREMEGRIAVRRAQTPRIVRDDLNACFTRLRNQIDARGNGLHTGNRYTAEP
jgi:hypothetical protein